jgi:hypothetical protein
MEMNENSLSIFVLMNPASLLWMVGKMHRETDELAFSIPLAVK